MNVLLALSLFSVFARPEVTPVSAQDLRLARELESRPTGASAIQRIDWQEAVPGQFVIGYCEGREGDAIAEVKNQGGTVLTGSITGGNFLVASFPVRDQSASEELIQNLQGDHLSAMPNPRFAAARVYAQRPLLFTSPVGQLGNAQTWRGT